MRKRPLFTTALLVVFLAALWLEAGAADRAGPGYGGSGEPEAFQELLVTGQVYQKDETSVYLRSVILSYSSNSAILSNSPNSPNLPNSANSPNSSNSANSADSPNLADSADSSQSSNLSGSTHSFSTCASHIICDTQQASQIPLGSTVTLKGIYAPFSHATNPGEFDAAEYYRTLGIGGRLRKAEVLELEEGHWPVREGLYQLKCCLRDRLYRILPQKDASVNRGLAGGYNSNVTKLVTKHPEWKKEDVQLYCLGNKGRETFARYGYEIKECDNDIVESPTYGDAAALSAKLLEAFAAGEIGEIYLAYTRFRNTVSHIPTLLRLLPVEISGEEEETHSGKEAAAVMNFEPEDSEALDMLIPKYVTSLIYGALRESVASENGARMQAMDNATSNAEEMISDLTLKYNRARQGSITQELTEIIAGAEALG